MRLIGISIVLVLSVFSTLAAAGTKTYVPVFINTGTGVAWGSVSSGRYSADGLQFIGCNMSTLVDINGNVSGGMQCVARDSLGNTVSCIRNDISFAHTLPMINSTSFLVFYYDQNRTCTAVIVNNRSDYLP